MTQSGYIDFHTHILPRIDDGSKSSDESLSMIRTEASQGVNRIVLTPHFYAEREGRSFFDKRIGSYDRLMEVIWDAGISDMSFLLGAEVCYFPGMGESSFMRELCIGDYMLLEMPFFQWDQAVVTDVTKLIERQGIKPVIAHIERYRPFQKDLSYWDAVFELPVIPQMNTEAFLGGFFDRRKNLKLFRDMNVIIGTDCHRCDRRVPNMSEGREALRKHFGQDRLEALDAFSDRIFEGMIRL